MKLQMKGIYSLLLCCFTLTGSMLAYAAPNVESGRWSTRNHYEVLGALGVSRANWNNQQLGVTSSETDTLVQNNSNDWNALVGQLGVGYVYYFNHAHVFSRKVQWFPSVEPQLNFYASSNRVDGTINRFGSPAFNEMSYTAHVKSARLMLDGALTVISKREYSLFVIGGIGAARSTIGYSDSTNSGNPCELSTLSLNNNNQTSFVWELGTGVDYAFNSMTNLSFEYLYTNFGNLKLPTSVKNTTLLATQITSSGATFYTKALMLGVHVGIG